MLKRKEKKARELKEQGDGFNFDWLPREGSYEGSEFWAKTSVTKAIQAKVWQKLFQAEITIPLLRKRPCHLLCTTLPFSLCYPICILWDGTKSVNVFLIKMGSKYLSSYVRTREGRTNRVLHTHSHKTSRDVPLCLQVVTSRELNIVFIFLMCITSSLRPGMINQYADEWLCLRKNILNLPGLFLKCSYYQVKLQV